MKLIRGKYRSRKSYKRATGHSLKGGSTYYKHAISSDQDGNRFASIMDRLGRAKKYLLSAGPLR